jgi:hypothetical protein
MRYCGFRRGLKSSPFFNSGGVMYYNTDDRNAGCAMFFVLALFILFIIDIAFGTSSLITSYLVDKRYVPQSSHVVITSNGKGHTSSHIVIDPEQFIFVVTVNGVCREFGASRWNYNQFQVQEPVFVRINRGYLTGWVYVTDVLKWRNPEG